MNTSANNLFGVRVIELPACKMATSKGHDLAEFDQWWSSVDKTRVDKFFPRDFMYFDKPASELVWLYALPAGTTASQYDVVDFAGGLYAAAISKDNDDEEGDARPVLFHVITSNGTFEKMKYRQLDIYLPVK